MYSETFFAVLVYASMIGLVFVYAFQVAVFVKDRRELKRERLDIQGDGRNNHRRNNESGDWNNQGVGRNNEGPRRDTQGAGRESSSPHHKENTNGSN